MMAQTRSDEFIAGYLGFAPVVAEHGARVFGGEQHGATPTSQSPALEPCGSGGQIRRRRERSSGHYFDISATSIIAAGSPVQEEFVWTIRNVGVDHVLLGSDFPQLSLPQTLAALDRLGLTPEEKAKIRYENARKLFGPK